MTCPYCKAEMPQSDRVHVLACRVEFEQNLPQRPEMYVDHHGWKRIKPGQDTETVRYIEYLERGPCCRVPWCGGDYPCERSVSRATAFRKSLELAADGYITPDPSEKQGDYAA